MKLTEQIASMQQTLDQAMMEAEKADAKNKASGTRLRGLMQEIKTKAQDVREAVLATR